MTLTRRRPPGGAIVLPAAPFCTPGLSATRPSSTTTGTAWPLLRTMFDFHDNEVRTMRYLVERAEDSAFPRNTDVNPTPTLVALAYRSLGRIRDECLGDPRPLDG